MRQTELPERYRARGCRAGASLEILLATLWVLSTMVAASHGQSEPLSYDVIFDKEAKSRTPQRVRWTEDGTTLGFLLESEGEKKLELLQRTTSRGSWRMRQITPHVGSETLSVDSYSWSPDGRQLLLLNDGDLYLCNLEDESVKRLTESEDEAEDPKFSPDGRLIAFVRQANLWVVDLSGKEEQLTEGGRPDDLLYAKTDWVYWEELWGRDSTGYWWSPDSRQIALYRFDETEVGRFPLLNSIELDPVVTHQRYPRAGATNPAVSVGVLDLDDRSLRWMETEDDEEVYLGRVTWSPDGSRLAIHRLNRPQNRLDLLDCDPSDGACRVFLREESSTWIDLEDDFRLLRDGRLLWGSRRDGWRRLYLYGSDGELLRQLTPNSLSVTSLDAVLQDEGSIIYTAHRTGEMGATDRQIYRLDLETGDNEALHGREGWHTVVVSPTGNAWAHTHSTANVDRHFEVLTRGGDSLLELDSKPAVGADRSTRPQWRFLTIPGPDGSRLPARMLEPSRAGDGPYPAIMYHYGGPASQVVVNNTSSRPTRDLWHIRMAERGYVVLQVDNEASVFFGQQGADRLYRRFGELELAAQRAGVEYLRTLPRVDGDRIGLWGWSGGGANTLYSILHSPGTWRAAVAGAPVTDWRLYDSIWTERYLGHPDDNEEGYRASSAISAASNLRDPLLLVHGTGDDNVHPSNTLSLSQKLIEAGLPFEQAIYPRQKHAFDRAHSRHFYERMEEFFDRHLRSGDAQ